MPSIRFFFFLYSKPANSFSNPIRVFRPLSNAVQPNVSITPVSRGNSPASIAANHIVLYPTPANLSYS